jgi:hypothetical protein
LSPKKLASLLLGTVSGGLIAIIWSFFLLVPYESIPDKDIFWTAFVIWAIPLVAVVWASRNKPQKRMNQLFGDVIIFVSLSGGVILFLQSRWSFLHAAVIAIMPGFLFGVLVGINSILIPRILKGQVGPGH